MRESVELFIRGVHLLAGDRLVRGCYLFYFRRDADSTTQFTAAKPVSNSQSFSGLDPIDDSCSTDDRRDGVLYRCVEQWIFRRK